MHVADQPTSINQVQENEHQQALCQPVFATKKEREKRIRLSAILCCTV